LEMPLRRTVLCCAHENAVLCRANAAVGRNHAIVSEREQKRGRGKEGGETRREDRMGGAPGIAPERRPRPADLNAEPPVRS
jgi:hypothetical protein